ncbi:hypothetical protein H8E50_00320 [bacterium]|nr:hypothetical protein [bacterium]
MRKILAHKKFGTKILILLASTFLSIVVVTFIGLKQINLVSENESAVAEIYIPLTKLAHAFSALHLKQELYFEQIVKSDKKCTDRKRLYFKPYKINTANLPKYP